MRRKGDDVKEEKLKKLKFNKEGRKHKKSHSSRAGETEAAVQEEKG
jgi:hypothetical protein